MIDMENTSEDELQVLDQTDQLFNMYVDSITAQCGSINPSLMPDDIMARFYTDFLKQGDLRTLEDRSIIIDENLPRLDKDLLNIFKEKLITIYENTLGIYCPNVDIFHLYCLYQVFVIHFADYFITYLSGLQKLDSDFDEDIPNWNELSLENYRKKIGDESPISVNTIYDYIDYIVENGIYPDAFIDVCLYESSGNVALSELILESSSNNIQFDDNFFKLKISKILLSDIIKNYIANKLIMILNIE